MTAKMAVGARLFILLSDAEELIRPSKWLQQLKEQKLWINDLGTLPAQILKIK